MPKAMKRSYTPSRSMIIVRPNTLCSKTRELPNTTSRRHQPNRTAKSFQKIFKIELDNSIMFGSTLFPDASLDIPTRRPRSASTPSTASTNVPRRLTKTGRPSRATKGLPVHVCQLCAKIYTRAEHLRRHELNHSTPKRACPVAGCRKQFYRDDLLSRHVEDHRSAIESDYLLPLTNSMTIIPQQNYPPTHHTHPHPHPQQRTSSAPSLTTFHHRQNPSFVPHRFLPAATTSSYDMTSFDYSWDSPAAHSAPALTSTSTSPLLDLSVLNLDSMPMTCDPFEPPFNLGESIPRSMTGGYDFSSAGGGYTAATTGEALDPQLVDIGLGPMSALDYMQFSQGSFEL